MNTPYTEGQWDDASKYPEIQTVRIFAKSHYLASVGNSDDTREQTEANARLMAASPDLVEALLEMVLQFEGVADGKEDNRILKKANAAIQKATEGAQ